MKPINEFFGKKMFKDGDTPSLVAAMEHIFWSFDEWKNAETDIERVKWLEYGLKILLYVTSKGSRDRFLKNR